MTTRLETARPVIREADAGDHEAIYRARHEVYALELGQHERNDEARLTDRLDAFNRYFVATIDDEVAAFISVTPPGPGGYSIDKYFDRADVPFAIDDATYEFRLLTVLPEHRDTDLAATLMVAAFRWIEASGGRTVVAIGREGVTSMYERGGMIPTGLTVRSGAVGFELMHADVAQVRRDFDALEPVLALIEQAVDWRLHVPMRKPTSCFHGGASFDAIGSGFDDLARRHDVVAADVLDAWFPPAPAVVESLETDLAWLLRTSPPTDCEGLVAAIAAARGLRPAQVLPGAGSSDLIFRALTHWLTPASRVVLLDPTYGEYAHVLEKVVGCRVERLRLRREDDYRVDLAELRRLVATGPDVVVLVNPNSPTGQHLTAAEVESLVEAAPRTTRVWVDETYVDYVGESVEPAVARHDHLVVCKSMSKAYALSGARVAYLAASPVQLEALRALTPPWVVGLPTQVAAVRALESSDYYAERWAETHELRARLSAGLADLGWDVLPGCASFVLAHLPTDGPDAAEVVAAARQDGVFVRDASTMGHSTDRHTVRIAVRGPSENARVLESLQAATHQGRSARP